MNIVHERHTTFELIHQSLKGFIDREKSYMIYNCKHDEFFPYLIEEQETCYVFAGFLATQVIKRFIETYQNQDGLMRFHIVPVIWASYKTYAYDADFSGAMSFADIFKGVIT